MATNGTFSQQDQYKAGTEQYPATYSGPTDASANSTSANGDLSKDEVGWYFVEQYYTTLSKSPEKLHLFYSKRSQFVSGLEAVLANVAVGRSAIQERIRELDFQDCKVRVSNVDSQASFDNIVIQVIGETSNKSAELRKFVQTFVLSPQPTGFFVLNDIFRYIAEEEDEEPETAPAEEGSGPLVEDVEMPKVQAAEAAAEDPIEVVEKKLEEIAESEKSAEATNGTEEPEAAESEVAEVEAEKVEEAPTPELAEIAVEEESKQPEKPKDPAPTPAISAASPTPAPQPAAPAKPLSWASRVAATAGVAAPKPAVPSLAKAATPPAQARTVPPVSKPAAANVTTTTTTSAAVPSPTPATEKDGNHANAGWQTAGDQAKRQNRQQSVSNPADKEGTMGYVRYVTEKVGAEELRTILASYGELVYFDINRAKNCAFVEYATPAGYLAAAGASPHQVAGESIYVEPRRPKSTAYGGNGYAGRGGMNNRGRGGFEQQGRPNPTSGNRGNFALNRGRGGVARGRGASQAPNA